MVTHIVHAHHFAAGRVQQTISMTVDERSATDDGVQALRNLVEHPPAVPAPEDPTRAVVAQLGSAAPNFCRAVSRLQHARRPSGFINKVVTSKLQCGMAQQVRNPNQPVHSLSSPGHFEPQRSYSEDDERVP
jgi:hypothetical protein